MIPIQEILHQRDNESTSIFRVICEWLQEFDMRTAKNGSRAEVVPQHPAFLVSVRQVAVADK